ncbi:AGE family epimerase/isomerase [Simiduia agarivorans]|uniref:N-acylglucosamine 2-epimerase n=1 Tax=Simiduia agarivorans (strain DSM 21679 / JCM 13881 / BCRC 17597 / SA1) TaxID=1117647 RepID=K4KN30_SIMAS|nr:AGE family epimerase/isomerase [Simiduia agarivorans]AFV00437.1 N-acylglucosamine 2-epimerase [Simiduia agarivorans SA1 = DSM 21679]
MSQYPDFQSPDFLRSHMLSILDFYEKNVDDNALGGFRQNFYDSGDVFDTGTKQLVSSTRLVFNYCVASEVFAQPAYLARAARGLDYVREQHWDPARKGYHWVLNNNIPVDSTNHCYGLAFVMLAYATAHKQGIANAYQGIGHTWDILEQRFWQADQGLYADEATPDWSVVSDYRGQNANMHCCEALLAAFEATGEARYLDRAYRLANTVAVELAAKGGGLVWEHFTSALEPDWEFNKEDPKNLYKPWGFQPGHQTEWSKLLLTLHQHRPEPWMVDRAKALFDAAWEKCWDEARGGLYYGHAPDGRICDDEKYFWVQAESFAAAAMLALATGESHYWDCYQKLWQYSWDHMIDHQYGAWYRVLSADNQPLSNIKSAAGAKCDYHTLGACYQVLQLLKANREGK